MSLVRERVGGAPSRLPAVTGLRLTLAGPDTLITSPLCARCPSGPAGCCAAPPAVAWADIGRIVRRGGADWLLREIEKGHLRPCPRGLAIAREKGPHGVACTYLGEGGCALPPDRRSVTCNEYLCEDALEDAARAGDPSASRARRAHLELERSLADWDAAIFAEVAVRDAPVVWDEPFLRWLGAVFERITRRSSSS